MSSDSPTADSAKRQTKGVSARPLRVGAVSYLNSKPLVHRFAELAAAEFASAEVEEDSRRGAELVLDVPSKLADRLFAGELDVALIPVFELFGKQDHEIITDACIASRGPVLSVKLFCRVPPTEIKTLALDEGSRTSAALVRILLRQQYGVTPRTCPLPIGATAADTDADAVLLIGDRAIHPPAGPFANVWDLGEEWIKLTGLPFVFAAWVAKKGPAWRPLANILTAARDSGVANLEAIAHTEAAKVGMTPAECLGYLRDNLHFCLGEREQEGLERFRQMATEMGLIESVQSADRESPSSEATRSVRATHLSTTSILEKAVAGERLSLDEGVQLMECRDLTALGRAADAVSRRMHPEPYRTYNIDRNINYTNICSAVCDFCAFYRNIKSPEAYVISREELHQKISETIDLGGNQILLQGGFHPTLGIEWYEDFLRDIKSNFPSINIHGFSPAEIHAFRKVFKMPLREILIRLRDAGMGSLPGGGAEILVDRVRKEITRGKCLTDEWLEVCRVWHELGGRGSATMMFGHVETLTERVEHLERLRQLQDETGGFTAFICWTFQPENTDMSHIPPTGAFEYLRTQAVARLYLDNIQNIQSSWVTQGLKVGQIALIYGANDMGSLMIEENVVASAGTVHYLTLEEIRDSIRELGYIPRQRNVYYEYVDSPPPAACSAPAAVS